MVHYSSDTSYTRIEYPSADPYSTYTMYNPADVRWDVLNDIMSSYNLHNYQILGLNGVPHYHECLRLGAYCGPASAIASGLYTSHVFPYLNKMVS